MERHAPKWFRRWLHRFDPMLRVGWNPVRHVWEIARMQPVRTHGEHPVEMWWFAREFAVTPVVEMTWPHANIAASMCELLRKNATWLWQGRFRDVWQERYAAPARAVHDAKRRAYTNLRKEIRKDAAGIARKVSGRRVTVGAIKNAKQGNSIKV